MEGMTIIKRDGTIETTVTQREVGEQCIKVRNLTTGLGEEISDEQIGPECETVETTTTK